MTDAQYKNLIREVKGGRDILDVIGELGMPDFETCERYFAKQEARCVRYGLEAGRAWPWQQTLLPHWRRREAHDN